MGPGPLCLFVRRGLTRGSWGSLCARVKSARMAGEIHTLTCLLRSPWRPQWGAALSGTPLRCHVVSVSAAEQDVLPDGPEWECSQMVQKDPGGVETQIPEPPGCRSAVTGHSCCSCCQDTCPSAARHPLGRFQTTCQPSQGGRRRRNLAAFLFKRKEEKNTQPHKEQNQ